MEELDPNARDVLRRYREATGLTAPARARVLQRLARTHVEVHVARRDQACTALGRGRPILEPATLGFMGLPGVCRRVRRCQEKGQGQRGGEHGRRS